MGLFPSCGGCSKSVPSWQQPSNAFKPKRFAVRLDSSARRLAPDSPSYIASPFGSGFRLATVTGPRPRTCHVSYRPETDIVRESRELEVLCIIAKQPAVPIVVTLLESDVD